MHCQLSVFGYSYSRGGGNQCGGPDSRRRGDGNQFQFLILTAHSFSIKQTLAAAKLLFVSSGVRVSRRQPRFASRLSSPRCWLGVSEGRRQKNCYDASKNATPRSADFLCPSNQGVQFLQSSAGGDDIGSKPCAAEHIGDAFTGHQSSRRIGCDNVECRRRFPL